jgi:hypothetical protein
LRGNVVDQPWKRMISLLYSYSHYLGQYCKAV